MPQKILIVDDEPSIVVPLQFLVEQNGYEAIVAHSGEEALKSVAKHQPALVLLDVMLPGMDGFKVCEIIRLKPEWKDTKIIFLTAKERDVDIAKGMGLGADEYITKPFTNRQIIDCVKKLL